MRADARFCSECGCDVCEVRCFGDHVRVAMCGACYEEVLFSAICKNEVERIEREVSQRISEVMQ